MTLEILKYQIINLVGNIVTYFLLAVLIIWMLSLIFSIKNDWIPFGWIPKLFKGIYSALKPVLKWLIEKLFLLLKILFKWLVFILEKIVAFFADILRKLLDLLRDPDE